MVRESQSSSGDSVTVSVDSGVTMIHNILLSGGVFNKLSVFGSSWLRLPLLKLLRTTMKESGFVLTAATAGVRTDTSAFGEACQLQHRVQYQSR